MARSQVSARWHCNAHGMGITVASMSEFYLPSQWTGTGLNPVCLAPKLPLGFAADRPYCGPFTTLLLAHGQIIALVCKHLSIHTRANRRVISPRVRDGYSRYIGGQGADTGIQALLLVGIKATGRQQMEGSTRL